jgi:hypothetical protein
MLADCAAASMGGKIYIGGGSDGGPQTRVQYLDISGGASSWKLVGPMIVPRSEFAMVALPSFGLLVAMGGYSPVSSRHVKFRVSGLRGCFLARIVALVHCALHFDCHKLCKLVWFLRTMENQCEIASERFFQYLFSPASV